MANLNDLLKASKGENQNAQEQVGAKADSQRSAKQEATAPSASGRPLNPFGAGATPSVQPSPKPANRLLQVPATGTSVGGGPDNVGVEKANEPIRSIDDLANDESAPPTTVSGFADETPAQKPTRELPPELTRQQTQFVQLIDGVYDIIHDTDLLGNVIKSIMIELKANPEYIKLITPDDTRTWVRGMRESMGLARVKKTEAKAKRASGGGRGKSKVVDSDMLQDLKDMGIDINADS